ncbi:MAG: MATE family efflux transporter [Candidatus Methanomethylophilaceae archaeon]|nr:MATE family efflux transporter [Candidatus Methanomethylophilaceae archaeon]
MGDDSDGAFSSKVSLNVLTNVVRTVIMALVGFMMVPYYIGEFGLAAYAIIPLITTITAYFLAMSDSLASAFTRYMAVAVGEGDMDAVNRTFTSSVVGMAKCILVMMPLVVLISAASPHVFDTGGSDPLGVQLAFLMIMVSSLMISFSACMGSVFMAYNRMYITFLGRIVHCVLQVGLVLVFFFVEGPSLAFIGVSYIVASVVFLGIMVVNLRRVCPTLVFSRRFHDPELLRRMSGLGVWAIVAQMGSLLFIQASMIVVNLLIGSVAQGSFSIAANMISMVNTACTSIAIAATPLVYRSYAQGDTDRMVAVLRVFTKFSGVMMAFPLVYIIVFAPQVVGVWLGPGYEELYPLLYIMLPVEVAVCTSNALVNVPVVYERLRPVAITTIALGVFNVVSTMVILEFTELGVLGACISWAVSMALLKLLFYPLYTSKLIIGDRRLFMGPMFWGYVSFGVLLVLGILLTGFFTLPTTWGAVIASALAGMAVYVLFTIRFMFNSEERDVMRSFLPGFVQRVFRI